MAFEKELCDHKLCKPNKQHGGKGQFLQGNKPRLFIYINWWGCIGEELYKESKEAVEEVTKINTIEFAIIACFELTL